MLPPISKSIEKLWNRPTQQLKVALKFLTSESSSLSNKITPVPVMQFLRQDLMMIQILEWSKEHSYRMPVGKFQDIWIQFIDPHPKLTEIPIQEVPRNLSDFDPEFNIDFKENSPFKRVRC